MADFGMGTQSTGRVEAWENWNNSYQVSIHYKLSVYTNLAYSSYGNNWNGTLAGGYVGSGSWTYVNAQGWQTLREFDQTLNKDANGNISIGVYGYIYSGNSEWKTYRKT